MRACEPVTVVKMEQDNAWEPRNSGCLFLTEWMPSTPCKFPSALMNIEAGGWLWQSDRAYFIGQWPGQNSSLSHSGSLAARYVFTLLYVPRLIGPIHVDPNWEIRIPTRLSTQLIICRSSLPLILLS